MAVGGINSIINIYKQNNINIQYTEQYSECVCIYFPLSLLFLFCFFFTAVHAGKPITVFLDMKVNSSNDYLYQKNI